MGENLVNPRKSVKKRRMRSNKTMNQLGAAQPLGVVCAFSTPLWFDNVVTGRCGAGSYDKVSRMKVFSA